MSITAALALSQVRKKRSRSFAAILAILLSTALTTAVCSFFVSGNAMLVETLGEGYGDYGGAYFSMLLIPGIIFGILIASMSVIVISNVFRISASERMEQFGTLKCVGATEKQITATVMYESLFLSLAGIPLGIIVGLVFTKLGTGIANQYFEGLNRLVHIMVNEITFSLHMIISWKALLASAVLSFFTVLLSAYLPAKKAAKLSAVECMKSNGVLQKEEKIGPIRPIRQTRKIEKELAVVNVNRSKHRTKSSVKVLSISMILFISLSGVKEIAEAVGAHICPKQPQEVIAEYVCTYEQTENPKTGREQTTYTHPIKVNTAQEISEKLKQYDETEFFGFGQDYKTYLVTLKKEALTPEMLQAQDDETKSTYTFPVEQIVLDQQNYEILCKTAGVEPGATILLNAYSYNCHGNQKNVKAFSETLHTLQLEKADGRKENIHIDAKLDYEQIPEELVYPNTNPVRLVVPNAEVRVFSWMSSPSNQKGYMKYANQVLEEYFPGGASDSYEEFGFRTRVYNSDDYGKVMNIAIMLAAVFLYSFVLLLAVIGLIHVVSSISTGIQMREREFAVLQSVGMTPEALRKMLNRESVLCTLRALCVGLPIGLIVIVLLNISIREIFSIPFCIPWDAIAVVVGVVFFVIWSTIRVTAGKLRHQNIIETIRRGSVG